jgi:hypothetical protein
MVTKNFGERRYDVKSRVKNHRSTSHTHFRRDIHLHLLLKLVPVAEGKWRTAARVLSEQRKTATFASACLAFST